MTDYISRDAAIEYVESLVSTMSVCVSKDECVGMKSMQQRAVGAIHDVPAADVAPVVRCINCRHGWAFFDDSLPGGPYVLCGKPYAAPRKTHKFDYFCADGKPKEDA